MARYRVHANLIQIKHPCRHACRRVVMITGDAPATAVAIARAVGVEGGCGGSVVSGARLARLTDAELETVAARTSIYARVSYEHKLRIVRALQRRGEVVAMTGDGVNDASALRAADIGVSLMPVLAGGPVLLLPLHVVLLELIIDPACSLVFEAEPEASDCMTGRHGRRMSAWCRQLRCCARWAELGADWMRLATLGALVAGNLLMLQRYRHHAGGHDAQRGNRTFAWLLAGVAAACAAILFAAPVLPQLGLPDHDALRVAGALFGVLGAVLAYRLRNSGAPQALHAQSIG